MGQCTCGELPEMPRLRSFLSPHLKLSSLSLSLSIHPNLTAVYPSLHHYGRPCSYTPHLAPSHSRPSCRSAHQEHLHPTPESVYLHRPIRAAEPRRVRHFTKSRAKLTILANIMKLSSPMRTTSNSQCTRSQTSNARRSRRLPRTSSLLPQLGLLSALAGPPTGSESASPFPSTCSRKND